MKTALVTGAAGFLGSHLCDYLSLKGFKVIGMDNLLTGKIDHIAHLIENENFKFIKHDVTEYIYIPGEVDYILHFASPASPIDYLEYPIQTLKVNALGTHKALGLAKEKKARFLLASTSEIYGDPLVHPQTEDYWGNVNPTGPRGVYDESKRYAEAITLAYHRTHGLETRIARIFNTYGPRMRAYDGRAVPTFINQSLDNKPITVFGDGSQTRSFCYVDDLVDGIYRLLMSEENDPVNLGNPQEMTILELAEKITEIIRRPVWVGNEKKIIFRPLPQDDPKIRQPDISRAKEILNWEPKTDLEKGLRATIDWFMKNRKEENRK